MADLAESLPIYIRIVEGVKDAILNGELKEESQLPSFVSAALSPIPVEAVSFDKDVTSETTRVVVLQAHGEDYVRVCEDIL